MTAASAADGRPVDAGLPPIDASALVSSLTATQLGELCDWSNSELGFYDASVMCRNFTITSSSRVECIASISYNSECFLTVAQFEACAEARVPTMGCDNPGPDCMVELECMLRDSGM